MSASGSDAAGRVRLARDSAALNRFFSVRPTAPAPAPAKREHRQQSTAANEDLPPSRPNVIDPRRRHLAGRSCIGARHRCTTRRGEDGPQRVVDEPEGGGADAGADDRGGDVAERTADTTGQRGVRADQPEGGDADDADHDVPTERDRTDDRRVHREERSDAEQQRGLVVGAERLDGEVLDEHGHVVDHPVADVEDRALPAALQSRDQLRDAERDDRRDQAGERAECGGGAFADRLGGHAGGSACAARWIRSRRSSGGRSRGSGNMG